MTNNASGGQENRVPRWVKLSLEDIVLTTAFIMGLGVGAVLSTRSVAPIISSLFIGVGIAALVYRFLGGISQSTSITIIGIKLGGAAAALIGIALIVNFYLDNQIGKTIEADRLKVALRKDLTLTFYKKTRPIEGNRILVKTDREIKAEKGKYILPLKDLEATGGQIFIDYQPEEEKGSQGRENITVGYKADPPGITLHLDFLAEKGVIAKNATLTFRNNNEIIRNSDPITVKTDTGAIPMGKKGEFILPFNEFWNSDSYIYIDWIPKEETNQEPVRITLQYKINPPGITLHLDDLAKKRKN